MNAALSWSSLDNSTIAVMTSLPPLFASSLSPASASPGNDTMHHIRFVSEVGLSMPIAIFGIIGNLLSIAVLTNRDARNRPSQTSSATLVLESLAVADTLVLVCTLLLRSFRYVGWPWYEHVVHRYVFICLNPTTYFIRLVDTWLTVLLTVDRHIAVCHPLHAQRLCSTSRTWAIIGVLSASAALFTIPRFFEYQLVDYAVSEHGFRSTAFMKDRVYTVVYRTVTFFVVMYVVPMTLMTVLNGMLLVALRRSQARRATTLRFHRASTSSVAAARRRSSSSASIDNKMVPRKASTASGMSLPTNNSADKHAARSVTAITVSIVLICIVCNMSAMASQFVYSLQLCFGGPATLEIVRRHLSNYSNVFVTLNSAVNFVVYCVVSRQFRCELARLVGCGRSAGGDQLVARGRHSGLPKPACCRGAKQQRRYTTAAAAAAAAHQQMIYDKRQGSPTGTTRLSVTSLRTTSLLRYDKPMDVECHLPLQEKRA